MKSVTPGQMVVKIVHDELVAMLGSDAEPIDLDAAPPVAILMVGLQGSGKTTTAAKIGWRLTNRDKKQSADGVARHAAAGGAGAARRCSASKPGVETLPIIAGQTPQQIANRAMEAGRLGGYDIVLLDTAGRVTIDEELMDGGGGGQAGDRLRTRCCSWPKPHGPGRGRIPPRRSTGAWA